MLAIHQQPNHLAGALNPYKFKGLEDVDTQVCEQYFRRLNRYKDTVRNKNGGQFRFFLLRAMDLLNAHSVCNKPKPQNKSRQRKYKFSKDYAERKKKHEVARNASTIKPDVPRMYQHEANLVIDVARMESCWEQLRSSKELKESAQFSALLSPKKKAELRRMLMDVAVKSGIVQVRPALVK